MTDTGNSPAGLPPRIGEYRILGLLGEGAMGRVFLAEQDSPHRQVALKVLKSVQLRSDFQQRFEREIELLAALEHPAIARLYAAGQAEVGGTVVPYLAMELVRGRDLLTHVRERASAADERLRLVAAVARAVHYAHTRGVVHRDLKPSNILVDEQGEPHVLDFGVAHVAGSESESFTQTGQVVGTLPYMSLEQLAGDARRADPRVDVYALGVIAYQLLADQLPYAGSETASAIAVYEQLSRGAPERLSRRIAWARGDIETLVMKAMAREPEQRYASAAEFAADIGRYLQRQPIDARPPTVTYVISLFVRRHRALAVTVAAAALGLLLATVFSIRVAMAEAAARQQAQTRLQEREAVTEFLTRMLTAADPEQTLGEKLTVADVLDAARSELDASAELPAAVAAQLRRTLGKTYVGLGRDDVGIALIDNAAQSVAAQEGAASQAARELRLDLVQAYSAVGRDQEARSGADALLAELQGETPEVRRLRVSAQFERGAAMSAQGDFTGAEQVLREALVEAEQAFGSEDALVLDMRKQLALALNRQARYADSLALAQEVAAVLERQYGAQHPRTIAARFTIALNLRDLARYREAEQGFREMLSARERIFGADHILTASTRAGLASVLSYDKRAGEAVPLARAAHEVAMRRLGLEADTARGIANIYAQALSENGEFAEAVRVLGQLVEFAERRPGGPRTQDLPNYNNLAFNLSKQGRHAEALPILETLRERAGKLVGREHVHYSLFSDNYGECLRQLGRLRAALPVFEQAHAVLLRELGAEHPRTRRVAERLAAVKVALKS